MQTEFVRNLHNNYERLLLDKKPEERKYQYCILSRGGIKGLLPCSLRYLNGLAYLYYDITSRQNMVQLYGRRSIDRQWMQDFMWSFQHIRQELERFLLDDKNILWYPEQIFQDLEKNIFSFLYVPYYEGENGFRQLIEFWVEHIDYEDEDLVEYVYKMYEQYEQNGAVYLQEQIFEDAKILERAAEETIVKSEEPLTEQRTVNEEAEVENPEEEKGASCAFWKAESVKIGRRADIIDRISNSLRRDMLLQKKRFMRKRNMEKQYI